MTKLGVHWLDARLSAELRQPVTDGVPRGHVTHKVVCLWLQLQLTFDDAGRYAHYFWMALIHGEDVGATHLAEVARDVGRCVERDQVVGADLLDFVFCQADPGRVCRATETPALAAVAIDDALRRRGGMKSHRAAIAAG